MKKRLVSMVLSIAILATSLPVSSYAENTGSETYSAASAQVETQNEDDEEYLLQYQLNGGTFAEGYQAPDTYPAASLPTWEHLEKDGYAFAGWYDNPELTGESITSVSDTAGGEAVVLYAKWTDSYYYIDIPMNIAADGSDITITGKAEGFYKGESASVTVNSENNWMLKDGDKSLSYGLESKSSGVFMENGICVMSLSKSEKNVRYDYTCNLKEEVHYTGDYTDTLTFDISYQRNNYTITYETNGGLQDDPDAPGSLIAIEPQILTPGTMLDELPVAIKSGYTFIGWCYDEACTKYVDTRDRLLSNITVYASYVKNQEQESHVMASFARAIDVDGDSFTIRVTDESGTLTAEQIRAACNLKNLSDFDEDVTIVISATGNHTYTISKANGWKKGSSYKLELQNDNLYFTGYDKTIREYEIAIYKEEVKNAELKHNIKYISINELSDLTVNGKSVSSVSVSTMTIGMDGNVQSEGSSTKGSFVYKGNALQIGDQIAVYEGDVLPNIGAASASSDADLSFFEITGADGYTYTYCGSDAEDVLFMPEVLPLQKDKDQDGDADNNSVTVNIEDLTFGEDEISQQLQLNADTTVDVGDFLAFYSSVSGEEALTYGKITNVMIDDGKYIIAYQIVTWNDVQTAMDVYTKEAVNGEVLLEGTDIQQLQSNIELQAVESGFAEEVANQIAVMAMSTDSFEKLEKSLQEELQADVSVYYTRSAAVSRAAAKQKVEVLTDKISVKADIGTKLKRFDGNISGVRLALELTVPIVIHAAQFADFEITIKATFEQEIRVDVNVDGEAIWKVWGIFPYIADYRVTASLDLYEYTGMALDINFKSAYSNNTHVSENDKKLRKRLKTVDDIVNELQDMMEDGQEYISSNSEVMGSVQDDVEASNGNQSGGSDEISVAKTLAERYAELLENDSDWVEIYKHNLVDKHIRILYGVIDINIELDFVVSANMNISIGTSFWYKNAKRYVFNLHVKGRKATSDTIDLVEEQYEFTAYAMGTLGIRAGVRVTIRVGLISTELASVGLSAEVGGYVQVWGYLYYELTYSASKGRNTRAAGALYLEIGIYLEIKFRAQALSNAFSYTPTLYDEMWPLYTKGSTENVIVFSYEEEPLVYEMKREIRNVWIQDSCFTMNYLDLKEGLDDGEYFTKAYEDDSDEYFVITMTNDAFTYNPVSNLVTVDPGNEKSVDGEMIITWISQSGTFDTLTKQRRIKLHWDNLRDGYCISFYSNGGSYIAPIVKRYGVEITQPENPTKQGYDFAGWYTDKELKNPYTFPETMADQDAALYAKWVPAKVNYTIKYYEESTNGRYELIDKIEEEALTESMVSPTPAARTGFSTPTTQTAEVKADGSTVIEYYYARNKYTITYLSDGEVVSSGDYRYGTMLTVPAVYKPGYDYKGWVAENAAAATEPPELVPAVNTTYTAYWEASSGIPYAVRYYVQNGNGEEYTLNEICYLTGTTGTVVTASAGNYDASVYHLKDAKLPSGQVLADGSLVLRVYYDLNTYTVTYDLQAEDAVFPEGTETTVTGRSGEVVKLAVPERQGYLFKGWYTDSSYETEFDGMIPDKDATIYAKWEVIKVNYTVKHYQENITVEIGNDDSAAGTSSSGYTLVEEEVFSAEIGAKVTPQVKTYIGFTAPDDLEAQTVTVDAEGNGNLVVEYYYRRNHHVVCWHVYGETTGELLGIDVQYGASITEPTFISKETFKMGYHVEGWYADAELTTLFTEKTMPDHDVHLYPNWVAEEITYTVCYQLWDSAEDIGSYTDKYVEKVYTAIADSKIDDATIQEIESYKIEGYTYVGPSDPEIDYIVHPENPFICYDFKANEHTLTYIYDTNEGQVKESTTQIFGADISREVPERAGFAFAGWYTEPEYQNLYTAAVMPDKDLILYGKWEYGKQAYQVHHYIKDLDGETESLYLTENLVGTSGETVTINPLTIKGFVSPEATRYTLKPGSVSDNQITFVYERARYQITYNLNGGEFWNRDTDTGLAYGELISRDVGKAGYTFAGWYLDKELTQEFTETVMPDRNLVLYAKWEAVLMDYTVLHYLENSENSGYTLTEAEELAAYTDTKVVPEVKTYSGFTSPKAQEYTVTGDGGLTIRYYYTRNTHTLTVYDFCSDGEDAKTAVQEMKYGASLPAQYRLGYTFGGWYLDEQYQESYSGMMPDADLTLYAKWIPKEVSYIICYRKQNEYGSIYYDQIVRGTAPVGSYITPESVEYEGFITPEIEAFELNANPFLNEKEYTYKRQIHTVTFKLGTGETDIVQTGYYGREVSIPNPSRTGYTFAGWMQDGQIVNPVDCIPAEDCSYEAKWIKNTYTITFTINGDEGSAINDIQVAYGDPVSVPNVTPTRKGYTFLGWETQIPETMPASNINIIAKWELNTYKLTYVLDGGTASGNPSTYTYESNEIHLASPTKANHTFLGWTVDGGTEYHSVIPRHSTGDHTYTAHWKENKYCIIFSSDIPDCINGGMEPVYLNYEDEYVIPDCKHTMPGHTFVGWSRTPVTPSRNPRYNYIKGMKVSRLTTEEQIYLYPVFKINQYRVQFVYNDAAHTWSFNDYDYNSYIIMPKPVKWGYNLQGWVKSTDNSYLPMNSIDGEETMTGYYLKDTQTVTWSARWETNNLYEYKYSSWENEYTITDGDDREVTFTFPIEKKQGETKGTGDYGLEQKKEDYVIPMENISRDLVSKEYSKIRVTISYWVEKVHTGYAVLRTSYVNSNGKTVKLETKSEDLDNAYYLEYEFVIDDTGAQSLQFEFDADGGGVDEYIIDGLSVKVQYEK